MKKAIECPVCKSEDVALCDTSKIIGISIGGLIGAILGYFFKDEDDENNIIGGFFTGSTIGYAVGEQVDKHVFKEYKCNACGKTFTL